MKRLTLIAVILLLSSSTVLAQDFCKGDFNYNGSVGAEDVSTFLEHFGRSPFFNPCPPDGPAPVEKTGQTISYATGDDGELGRGVEWPNPRFNDRGNGTVIDNLTGLTWLKDANCIVTNYPEFDNDGAAGNGGVSWTHAIDFIAGINDGSYSDCGAGHIDWRLPNVNELLSLIDRSQYNPALPLGHPFDNVVLPYGYWSSTAYVNNSSYAWYVHILPGKADASPWTSSGGYVWPVRGGH